MSNATIGIQRNARELFYILSQIFFKKSLKYCSILEYRLFFEKLQYNGSDSST